MKRYDLTENGYRRKFRTCKPAEGESRDIFIVHIVTYLDRWIELSKTDKSYEKLKDLIVREQFMDACPEDLATSLREKDLPTLERVAKEADLFLQARNRKLCDQPRKVFQGNFRPRMDSVRPLKPEKKFNGGQRAGEAKTGVADQRSCFKCKKTGHIAREVPQESTHFAPFVLLYGRTVRGPMHILRELWTKEIEESDVKSSYEYVLNLRERLDDTLKITREELEKAQGRQKHYYDRTAKRRNFSVGEKVLVLLPTDSNKLLMQWKGPFEIVATAGINDYRINMGGKEKTFHANLLKGYIARDQDVSQATTEERPPTSSLAIPAASATVIEDLEGEHFNDSDCEALPELGGWGSKETVNDLKFGDELTLDQRRQLEEVALMYSSIFSNRPGTASTEEHCIELTSSIPVRQRPYPVPYAMRQTLRDELSEMEALGVIRKSSSPYASPGVVVKKDGTNRVCIDYRRLNKLTIFDPQPMTKPADIFQGMEKDQYFSKIGLSKGYWKIPVRKEDIPKTVFVTMDCHYEFLRMPFGMMNSGATLTRAVKKLLCGMDNVVDYIDDLLIHTETWEAHVKTLSELFRRFQDANFTARPVKCLLGSRTVDFLGHSLGRGAIGLQDEHFGKVRNAPRPKTKREVKAFSGLVGYYKEFVPNFAAVSAPLSDLVRKGQPNVVNWGDSQERAYNSLKVAVTSKPVLQLPDVLRTDASDRGLGAALMQDKKGTIFPVAYASKKFTDRERQYSVTEREALAIVWGVKKFSLYLFGTVFTLQTDHGALQFLNAAKFDSPRIMRWALALQVYNFDVQYIKGSENVGADYLSRIE
ncbi:Zinc finger protein [Plakobranchus ocellatus]|uniref:Zinc finger protein n=1 Tax=Plakobranchus ocellatus TaxID=259542 RepID=A0AAV4BY26_9GAST|nr:Zinc finger protein [Plakobranchus ocellatus]